MATSGLPTLRLGGAEGSRLKEKKCLTAWQDRGIAGQPVRGTSCLSSDENTLEK